MAETPAQFHDRVAAAQVASPTGRLPVPDGFADSDIFPLEPDELTVKVYDAPVVPEPPRDGEPGGKACRRCENGEAGAIWADERWLLSADSGVETLPFAALLQPREHLDIDELDAGMAAELGTLVVGLQRAIKEIGNIGRVHVNVWGDGGSHLHVWLLARPLGQLQLRGSCLPLWLDLLPPIDGERLAADQRVVVANLVASHGGRSLLP